VFGIGNIDMEICVNGQAKHTINLRTLDRTTRGGYFKQIGERPKINVLDN